MDPSSVSSRVAIAGLVGLVALDVVLVGLALRPSHPSVKDTSPLSSASASVDSGDATASPSSTPSGTSSTTATVAVTTGPAAPLQTMLVAIDNQRAWRVRVGSCAAGGAKLVVTTDGGKTWADAKAPLRTIVRVRPTDGQAAFVIGADSSCAAEFKSTTNGGGTWGSGSAVGLAWFRDPKNPMAVKAPWLVHLAALRHACCPGPGCPLGRHGSGAVRRRSAPFDDGHRFVVDRLGQGHRSGGPGRAVGQPGQTYVARLNAPDCEGVQILRVDKSVATSCIKTSVPKDPGQVALSLVDGGGWLAVGDTTMRSTDALVTWSVS